jgi:hypothetical protein
MHIDFALPVNHNMTAGLEVWRSKAASAVMDYGFHMAVTRWDETAAAEMAEMVEQGINSFKFFMAYKACIILLLLLHCVVVPASCHDYCKTNTQCAVFQIHAWHIMRLKHACTGMQGALMVNDQELLAGFMRCAELGALPMVR